MKAKTQNDDLKKITPQNYRFQGKESPEVGEGGTKGVIHA